jgi:hypothetical protein
LTYPLKVNVYNKPAFSVADKEAKLFGPFVPGMPFLPSIIFASNAEPCPSGVPFMLSPQLQAPELKREFDF